MYEVTKSIAFQYSSAKHLLCSAGNTTGKAEEGIIAKSKQNQGTW